MEKKIKEALDKGLLMDEIDNNRPIEYTIKGRKYKIKRATNYVHGRFSRLVTKAQLSYSEDAGRLVVNMDKNRKLVPKCVSLMKLSNPIKVWLFHPIYWRYLYLFVGVEELKGALTVMCQNSDLNDLFFCLSFLQSNNGLLVMMAKESTSTILPKLKLADGTTPSQPSTGA